jgi:hypothetical protein
MRGRFRPFAVMFALVIGSAAVTGQKPAAADILNSAAAYLVSYAEKIGTIAAEEEYTQRDATATLRAQRLHSDVVIVGFDKGVVATFRDVFAIDNRPVRQRDDRLLELFHGPVTDAAQAQANALSDEGVRYYISPNLRAFDSPTLALDVLLQENQGQSEFSLDGIKTIDGAQVAILKFNARNTQTVIKTSEGAALSGRFWIEAATGTVRQTEMVISSRRFMFKVNTKYALDPGLALWLPVEVFQQTDMSGGAGGLSNMGAGGHMGSRQALEGRASYSKFRRAN